MTTTRITGAMRRSLELRLEDLEARIEGLDAQRDGEDDVDATALLVQLARERAHVVDALRHATVIDNEPFDFDAIEVGDLITVQDEDGEIDTYVLVDDGVGTRARSDWVSVGSPLGAAILGRDKGQRVEVESPQGATTYVIVDFERTSEPPRASAAGGAETESRYLPSEAFLG